MTKLTTERLEQFIANPLGNPLYRTEQMDMARQLLAYEQAANEVACWGATGQRGQIYPLSPQTARMDSFPLYRAPVLPKQPELIGMKVSIDTGSDNIGHRLFGEIVGTSDSNGVPVLCIEVAENNGDMAAPAQPVIPEQQQPIAYIFKHPAGRLFWSLTDESNQGQADVIPVYADPHELKIPPAIEPDYEVIKGILPTANPDEYACCIAADMWNACRAEMLKAQPVSEPYKLISVKDDTPTESGDYWCYLGKDFESPTKYRVVHFDVRHHEFQDHRVTHWMRLPAEPEREA